MTKELVTEKLFSGTDGIFLACFVFCVVTKKDYDTKRMSWFQMDQDPGAFDDNFATTVRSVYELRYSLLPLLYTLFAESHMTGEPVARAMFYQYVILVLSFSEVNMWNS